MRYYILLKLHIVLWKIMLRLII